MIYNRHRELMSGGVDPQISLSRNSITFDANASTATITLTANTDWTLSSNGSWCTLSKTSGKKGSYSITVTVPAYTDNTANRNCVLTAETRRRSVTALCTVTQNKDYITSTVYSIGNITAGTTSVGAGGGTSTISGGAGSITYSWKSGKADTTGSFTPDKSVTRTSGSTAGTASISSSTVTVNSLVNNYYNGNTVFTVTYSYTAPTPATGTVTQPTSKTCTITQAKNVCTITMGTVSGGAITSSNSYAAKAESKTFSNSTAASISGVTIIFSSGTQKTDYSNYGTLSGPTYSWASNQTYFTLSSSNASSLAVSSVTRGTDYSESTRSATITRTASYTYTLSSSYGGTTASKTGSCTGTATQAANMLTVTSAAVSAGAVTSSLSFTAGKQTKSVANSTAASTGTVVLTFDSGSTATTPTNYGSWSAITYAWSSSNTNVITLTSSNASSLSVSSVNRGTTVGDARSATVTRTATATFTLSSTYDGKGGSAISKTTSASTTCTCTQDANTVTYELPQFKGLGYDKLIDASGGTANITGNGNYVQLATYTSDAGTIEVTSGATITYQRANMMSTTKGLDPEMFIGLNGISRYDNNSSGKTTIARVSSGIPAGCPNNSGYALKITNTGEGPSPGLGGWHISTTGAPGETYICTFNAYVPVGYTVKFISNSTGDETSRAWQTPRIGTGSWRTYSYLVTYGTTGSMSTTFYFYLIGPAGSESEPLVWYVNNVYLCKVSNISASTPTINTSTGAVTLATKGTTASDINVTNYGAVQMTVTMNGKTGKYVLYPEQAKNEIINTNYNPTNYTAAVSIGSGIGPGTNGNTGTSATVTYSAYHTASDLYTSRSSNNSHTVYDTATVTKTTDANSKYTLSGNTSGSSSSNTCTLSLGNMGTTATTYSCTLTCTNGASTSTTKTATASATNSVTSYSDYTISGSKSTSSNIPIGGTTSYYITFTSTRKPNYSSGAIGAAAGCNFKIDSMANCELWTASGATGTKIVAKSTSLSSGSKVYFSVGNNYNTLSTRSCTAVAYCADNTSTGTAQIGWTQTADTSTIQCYKYAMTLTKSSTSNLPCAASSKTYYVTLGVTRTPHYKYTTGGGEYDGTSDNTGTINVSGTNCTCTDASGNAITTATNNTKIYLTTTSNGVTSGSTSSTRTCTVNASVTGCETYTQSVTWTQAKDTASHNCYRSTITLTKNSTSNIAVGGGTKVVNAKLGITREDVYKWATGGGTYVYATDHTGTASLTASNATIVNSAGTTISTAGNDTSIYLTVGANGGTASTRTVSLTATITGGCDTATQTASWTQNADSKSHNHYEYTISLSRSSTSNIACGGISTVSPYATLNVIRRDMYKWAYAGTVFQNSSDNTGTANLSGSNCTVKNSSGTTITTATNGTKIYYTVGSNGGAANSCTSSTRTVRITASITSDNSQTYSGAASWTQSADTKTLNCYRYDVGLTPSSTANIANSGTSKTIYATVSVTRYHVYKWATSGNTAECANDNTGTVNLDGTGLICTDVNGTAISTATNGTKVYITVGTNYQTTSTLAVSMLASITGCNDTVYSAEAVWGQNADSISSTKYEYDVTWNKSSSSNISCGGTSKTIYATCILRRVPVYTWASGGVTRGTANTSGSVTVTGTNCTCTNSAGTTITTASNGTKVYISVSNNNHNTSTRTIVITPSAGTSAYSSGNSYGTASWTQSADTHSVTSYSYSVSLTKGGSYSGSTDSIPCSGTTKAAYVTCNLTRTCEHTWASDGARCSQYDTTDNTGTMTVTGSNCTCTNSSDTAISSIQHGGKVYIRVGNNNQNTGAKTIEVTVAPPSGTSQSASWTQAADTRTTKYEYTVSWQKGGSYSSANIPCAGTEKAAYATCSISRVPVYTWGSGGTSRGSAETGGSVTVTGSNCTCTNVSGTTITSASNGTKVYIKVTNNNQNTNTRTIKITPSAGTSAVSSGNTYNTVSWTQAADTRTTKYEYTTTVTKNTPDDVTLPCIAAAVGETDYYGTVSISRVPVYTWGSGGTTRGSAGTGGTVNISGINCVCTNVNGTQITSASNGTKVYILWGNNQYTTSTNPVTIITGQGAGAADSGHSYGSATWTQSGDTKEADYYKYTVTWTKGGSYTTSNIPIGGVSSKTTVYATCNITRNIHKRWASDGTAIGYEGTDNGGSVTIAKTSGISGMYNASGTAITSASNGMKVYITVSSAKHKTSKTNKITPSAGTNAASSGNSYGTVTWAQNMDSKYVSDWELLAGNTNVTIPNQTFTTLDLYTTDRVIWTSSDPLRVVKSNRWTSDGVFYSVAENILDLDTESYFGLYRVLDDKVDWLYADGDEDSGLWDMGIVYSSVKFDNGGTWRSCGQVYAIDHAIMEVESPDLVDDCACSYICGTLKDIALDIQGENGSSSIPGYYEARRGLFNSGTQQYQLVIYYHDGQNWTFDPLVTFNVTYPKNKVSDIISYTYARSTDASYNSSAHANHSQPKMVTNGTLSNTGYDSTRIIFSDGLFSQDTSIYVAMTVGGINSLHVHTNLNVNVTIPYTAFTTYGISYSMPDAYRLAWQPDGHFLANGPGNRPATRVTTATVSGWKNVPSATSISNVNVYIYNIPHRTGGYTGVHYLYYPQWYTNTLYLGTGINANIDTWDVSVGSSWTSSGSVLSTTLGHEYEYSYGGLSTSGFGSDFTFNIQEPGLKLKSNFLFDSDYPYYSGTCTSAKSKKISNILSYSTCNLLVFNSSGTHVQTVPDNTEFTLPSGGRIDASVHPSATQSAVYLMLVSCSLAGLTNGISSTPVYEDAINVGTSTSSYYRFTSYDNNTAGDDTLQYISNYLPNNYSYLTYNIRIGAWGTSSTKAPTSNTWSYSSNRTGDNVWPGHYAMIYDGPNSWAVTTNGSLLPYGSTTGAGPSVNQRILLSYSYNNSGIVQTYDICIGNWTSNIPGVDNFEVDYQNADSMNAIASRPTLSIVNGYLRVTFTLGRSSSTGAQEHRGDIFVYIKSIYPDGDYENYTNDISEVGTSYQPTWITSSYRYGARHQFLIRVYLQDGNYVDPGS